MVLGMINEIQQYLDARYIGPPEAAWRIFGHPLHVEMPTVVRLALHLPGMHHVVFNLEESLETIQSRAGQQISTLTGFFAYCAGSEDECPFTYQEFPQHYVWLKSEKRWKSREMGYAIGRMYFASPNCGERFYLRLLLTVVKGPKSFQSLRTIDNVVHDTFKLACVAMGLLEDDEEWIQCLKEAVVMKTGYQLRRLFSIILTQCSPLNPCKSLIDFPPMPQPTANWSAVVDNQLIFEHQQLQIFQNKGTVFFLNGGAGTGKTFLYNTIALKCRSLEHIVVTVASSGIASLLLVGGRTAHSTFSIPLDVLDYSNCGLSKQSLQAELFRETKLIIWDEVPMQHRHCVEAVDRTLRDICDSEKPFGGITIVLSGDFRQILPVIPKRVREQIVNASLRHSVLWKHIHILTLDLNMRLNHESRENANFANFLMEIGTNPQEIVNLPSTIHKCQDLNELLSTVYPRYPNEYLNSLDPPGLPTFKLELKVGCPIILLRNIAPKDGLCNGTRLMVTRCDTRIIEAQILTREKFGNLAFIPRISLAPSSSEMPFQMTRRQFPVRLAFALTINKSQGQSVKFVGVDLRIPVFSHGQLYVALSRCTSFDRISILLPKDCLDSTTNIVYPELEILHKEENKVALGFVSADKGVGKDSVVPASGSVLADKAAGKALAAPTSVASATQPLSMVVATTASIPSSREPTISEELPQHKKQQKGFDKEIRSSNYSSLAGCGSYLVSFWDPEFRSDIFSMPILIRYRTERGYYALGNQLCFTTSSVRYSILLQITICLRWVR
ncbi:uncharacterized protein LOC127799809 [Diospyros lotus]|uniref:uncharacterized protein LOC127799809 n=1 Tax=Diospyros lotus TaxID=55363 RepID=UPI002258E783|nr:uncharacterized protein LOC127799809 [Diospyros lotus]